MARPRSLIVAALAALHLGLAALVFVPTLHPGGDNAAYLDLARSILERGRYLSLWDPAAPPQLQYPPGFPALLAAAMAAGIGPWVPLKVLMAAISALAVALSYLWARTRVGPWSAAGVGLVVAAAPGVLAESHWILSDVPFWAATMAALLAAERGRPAWGVALAFVALAFRTAGLPLVLAFAAVFALRRRWRAAAGTVGAYLVVATAWLLRARTVEVPYTSELWLRNPYDPAEGTVGAVGLLARIADNAARYVLGLVGRVLTGDDGAGAVIAALALLLAATLGWAVRVRGRGRARRRGPVPAAGPGPDAEDGEEPRPPGGAAGASGRIGVAELWVPLYTAMLLLWPAQWAAARFLLPVLPVLLVWAVEGAGWALGAVAPPGVRARLRWAGVAVVAVILAAEIQPTVTAAGRASACRRLAAESPAQRSTRCLAPSARTFLALAEWSRDRLPPDAVVLSRKPTLFHWFSGHPGRTYPYTDEAGPLLGAMESAGARYLVVDHLGSTATAYLEPAVRRVRERFCLAQRMGEGSRAATLLGLLPAARERPTGEGPEPGEDDDEGATAFSALDFPPCPAGFVRPPAYSSSSSSSAWRFPPFR